MCMYMTIHLTIHNASLVYKTRLKCKPPSNIPIQAQAVLLAIVAFVSLSCVVMKVLLSARACYHSRNQRQFVEWNRKGLGDNSESAVSFFIRHVLKSSTFMHNSG